ncbi:calmodulin-like [Saccostrea echinata]|uniref:calmodulin-like n=1 Tax=Saccostrea echinata TaxID=191078 RepID=UPI002A830020|nr:calmodulin-like [Saccostrea echinata]
MEDCTLHYDKPEIDSPDTDDCSAAEDEEVPEVTKRAPSHGVITSISEDDNLKEPTPNWEDYKVIFDKFDADKDGYLSSNDIRQVLLSYDIVSTEGELQDVIAEFDKKGNGLVTLEKFVSVMNSHKGPFSKKDEKDFEFHEVFRVLDKTGTGSVTPQALCEFMAEFEPSFDEEHAFELVKQFDTKGNGDLCFEDFVKLLTARM